MTDAQREQSSGKIVMELSVMDGKTPVTRFIGPVEVRIPYALNGQDANGIVVHYMDEQGGLSVMKNTVYDASSQAVVFTTTHFSKYMVSHSAVTFTDIAGHWAQAPITRSAAKSMAAGYPDGSFKPDAPVTRAEFVQLLYNAADITFVALSGYAVYADVTNDQWYYTAIGAAKQNSLLDGLAADALFLPNQPITRQEMAVILANLARIRNVPETNASARSFIDSGEINPAFAPAVELAINTGFLNEYGMGDGRFAPSDHVTRAQAAAIQAIVVDLLGKVR